jgi:hypothetical protein
MAIFKNSPPIVTDGLVLYLDAANTKSYPTTGTTWNDLVGLNNGTLTNGPTFSSDNGGSIVFDGVDDYVNYGNILNFERTDNFSFSIWVRANTLTTFSTLIAKMDSSALGYYFAIETNGALVFILRNTVSTNNLFVRTPQSQVEVNRWYNLTVTYNGTSLANGVSFYINATPSFNVVSFDNLTSTITTSQPGSIAARPFLGGGYLNGRIPSVQIYNRALSASEVLQNYNATKQRFNLT